MRSVLFLCCLLATVLALPQIPKEVEDQLLVAQSTSTASEYFVGVGKADITGPIGTKLFGYDIPKVSDSLHTRLYARAFIFQETTPNSQPLAYVVADRFMLSDMVVELALQKLGNEIRDPSIYKRQNVAFLASHTHSGTSVYSEAGILQLSGASVDFNLSDKAFVLGLCTALKIAHYRKLGVNEPIIGCGKGDTSSYLLITPATATQVKGFLIHKVISTPNSGTGLFGIQRSPDAWASNNAKSELSYSGRTTGVDSSINVLKIIKSSGTPEVIGSLAWLRLQSTSLSREAAIISGDNKGVASYLLERKVGKPTFVGAFAFGAGADVSPGIKGPKCINDDTRPSCDFQISATIDGEEQTLTFALNGTAATQCGGNYQNCQAFGPGDKNDVVSANEIGRIVSDLVYNGVDINVTSVSAHSSSWRQISGKLRSGIRYSDYTAAVTYRGTTYPACGGALGKSYLAGTIDGTSFDTSVVQVYPGMTTNVQGATSDLVSFLASVLISPHTDALDICQAPKPVLGGEDVGASTKYIPKTGSTQVFALGDTANALWTVNIPFSVTNFAGFSMAKALKSNAAITGTVILSSTANTYRGFVTTEAEYGKQRFEGAATIYGPKTYFKVAKFAEDVLSCVSAGNCGQPVTATANGCPASANSNCHPYIDPSAPNQLNDVANWVLNSAGQIVTYRPGAGVPANFGACISNSNTSTALTIPPTLSSPLRVTAQFNTARQFTIESMAGSLVQVYLAKAGGPFVLFYTEQDPETVVSYSCANDNSTTCTATVIVYFPLDFQYSQYTQISIVHNTYYQSAAGELYSWSAGLDASLTAAIGTCTFPFFTPISPSLTPSPSPSRAV